MSSGVLLAQGLALLLAGTDGLPLGRVSSVAAAPVKVLMGALEVVTRQPGLPVVVDEILRGRTPVRVDGLSPGMHRVQVGKQGTETVVQEVLIRPGVTVKLEPVLTSLSQAPQQTATPVLPAVPGMAALRSMFSQPWAYATAALCGASLLAAGVLWTSSPDRLPIVGKPPMTLSHLQFQGLRWSAVGLVALTAVATVILFALPALPFMQDATEQRAANNAG